MKQFRKLILASTLTLSGFAAVIAGGTDYGTLVDNPTALQNKVINLISIPVPTQGEFKGEVDFVFRVNAQGRIEVLSAVGDHAEVVLTIKKALDDERINVDHALVGKTYRMNFKYQTPQDRETSPEAI